MTEESVRGAPTEGASPLRAAARELLAAVAALEDALEHRRDTAGRRADLDVELQRVGADRSRLAAALDGAEARAARLEDANKDVSRRLVAAMETIRGVLERSRSAA